MFKRKNLLKRYSQLFLLVMIISALVYLICNNLLASWNIFLAVMGFSAVVFIHECGHFIVAKLSDIKVEVFSIFLPPVLVGVRRTEDGFRFRILPKFFPKDNDEQGDGLLSFAVGKKGKAGETEYRVGLIPLAGYVKMLGQEDTGADTPNDDPRSFANKSISTRMMVVTAGVIFNVIAAIGVLMTVYTIGVNQPPAVVGTILPDSPAAKAGLVPGDEIVEICGKQNPDFSDVLYAAIFSDPNETVAMTVMHTDGSKEEYKVATEAMEGSLHRDFGFDVAETLKISQVSYPELLSEKTELKPGDEIFAINRQEVRTKWEFDEIIENTLETKVTLFARRTVAGADEAEIVETEIPLVMAGYWGDTNQVKELSHVYSMVPRLKILNVSGDQVNGDNGLSLQSNDIILAAGDVKNPTYKELRDITEKYEDKKMPIEVLRVDGKGVEQRLSVAVMPKRSKDGQRVIIGIFLSPAFDGGHAVISKTIDVGQGVERLAIPRGATITAVNGVKVSSFYDIIREIKGNIGKRIMIAYHSDDKGKGNVALNVSGTDNSSNVRSVLAEFVPFERMQRLYKADNPGQAFTMACSKSTEFILRTYVTLKGLFAGNINPKAMSGPVGIATISYKVVGQSGVSFLYLLAFISANLAVINFLPIPVVDGGVFVLLIVEKIKGSPVSIRIQEVISYAGLILIGTAFLYLTYNDIANIFR